MRLLSLALLLFPFVVFSRPVRYEISPLFKDGTLRLQVRVWFAGDADGETKLLMPNGLGKARHLFRCVQNLVCNTPGSQLWMQPDSSFVSIRHASGQELKLYYEIAQDFPGASVPEQHTNRPIIQPDYFHVLGSAFFVVPQWNEGYEVTLEWRNFPDNWLLHNSFGAAPTSQQFSFQDLRWLESVFIGGDYRIHQATVSGNPVWLAIRGSDWDFSDDSLLGVIQSTVTLQRNFWQDFETPCYTVLLTPLAQRPAMSFGRLVSTRISYSGLGLHQSFSAFATPHNGQDWKELCGLFHHELMHHWIGSKIRSGCQNMQMAWFTEGFTDYFALKNMLEGGFLTPSQYVEHLNEQFFDALYRSPRRESPNSVIADSFFVDPKVEKLPYLRGCVFAFFLDNAIKSGSNGQQNLHQLMLDLLEYYERPDRDLLHNFDFFLETCSDYLKKDITLFYQEHIVDGRLITADEFLLPAYLKMEVDEEGSPFFWLDKSVAGWEKSIKE